MPDLQGLFDRSAKAAGATLYWTSRTARLMIGVPDYETYVAHRRANHPQEPISLQSRASQPEKRAPIDSQLWLGAVRCPVLPVGAKR